MSTFRNNKLYRRAQTLISPYASPDFMIIGAAKSGTTSLFHYLAQHPDVIPPQQKEPAYFDWHYDQGLKWYLSQFPLKNVKNSKLTFEATPTYLLKEKIPEKIKNIYPKMKFIIILRNPIERAYSQWNFFHNSTFVQGKEMYDRRSFEQAINDELNAVSLPFYWQYLKAGQYAEQIRHWQQFYSQDSFLILDFADLKYKPKLLLQKCTEFLKLSDFYQDFEKTEETIHDLIPSAKNENRKLRIHNFNDYNRNIPSHVMKILTKHFAPHNQELYTLLNRTFSW